MSGGVGKQTALQVAAAVAAIPRFSAPVLERIRWRQLRPAGDLAGAAIAVLIASSCAAPVAPPQPVTPTAAHASPSSAAPASAVARATRVTASPPIVAPTPTSAAGKVRAAVVAVVDGDTIRVLLDGRNVTVRYIGVDTPETVDPRRPVGCFGKEAAAYNAALVSGKTVELEKDVSETDAFGRLLRYVWVGSEMVNEQLVRDGYATASTYPPDVRYQERFRELEAGARDASRGLWGPACAASPAPTASAAPTRTPPSTTTTAPTVPPSPAAGG